MDVRIAGLALLVLVAGCSPATPQAAAGSPSASSSPVASTSPVAPTRPSPTWTLGLGATAVSPVDFTCRLPVFVEAGQGSADGFVDLPSGTVTSDPAAPPSVVRAGRELVGNYVIHYYDRAYSRWLPVSRNDVSPDGSHYAFADRAIADPQNPASRAQLHVVDVKSGAELVFDDGDWSRPYEVLDYTSEGIYLVVTGGYGNGLWLMNPTTGATAQVASLSLVEGRLSANSFWVGVHNPDDPHPVGAIQANELDLLSMPDGARVTWLYAPGNSVYFSGQDVDGHPIVLVADVNGASDLRILLAPGSSRSIWIDGNGVPVLSNPISDKHGVWFGSQSGIFLYSDANGMQKISNQSGFPGNGCV
jgi:hypothetical protein